MTLELDRGAVQQKRDFVRHSTNHSSLVSVISGSRKRFQTHFGAPKKRVETNSATSSLSLRAAQNCIPPCRPHCLPVFLPALLWFRTEGTNFCSQPPRFFLLRCCCRAGRNGGLCDSTGGGLWVDVFFHPAVHGAESCTRPNFAQEPYDGLIDDLWYYLTKVKKLRVQ